MLQSHAITIDGVFVGVAVRLDIGYRFVATDMKLEDLDGSIWPSLAEVERLARGVYLGARTSLAYPGLAGTSRGATGGVTKMQHQSGYLPTGLIH